MLARNNAPVVTRFAASGEPGSMPWIHVSGGSSATAMQAPAATPAAATAVDGEGAEIEGVSLNAAALIVTQKRP
jgi:hypothetical protein